MKKYADKLKINTEWHKALCLLLALMVISLSLPALAEEDSEGLTYYEGGGIFQGGSLEGPQEIPETEKEASPALLRAVRASSSEILYREILDAMQNCAAEEITYRKSGGTICSGSAIRLNILSYEFNNTQDGMDSVYYLYAKAVNSNPRYFYFIPNVLFSSSGGKLEYLYMMVNAPIYDQKSAYEKELAAMAAEAVPDRSNMSETEIALAAHDYFTAHTSYDWDAFYGSNRYENYPDSFSAYGAVVKKRAVCQGLSLGYMDLLSRLGLQCMIVPSYTLGHAWNLVYADGSWYHADITNAIGNGGRGRIDHRYFMLSDAESAAIHHGSWSSDGVFEAAEAHTHSAFWRDVESCMYRIGGYWYYNDGSYNTQSGRCEGDLMRTSYGAARLAERIVSNVSFPVRADDLLFFNNYSNGTIDAYAPADGSTDVLFPSGVAADIGIEALTSSGEPVPSGYICYKDQQAQTAFLCANSSLGDADGDGAINVMDLLLIGKTAAGGGLTDVFSRARADVDWDTLVNDVDADCLGRYIVKLNERLRPTG